MLAMRFASTDWILFSASRLSRELADRYTWVCPRPSPVDRDLTITCTEVVDETAKLLSLVARA